jgi:O-antigen ligase
MFLFGYFSTLGAGRCGLPTLRHLIQPLASASDKSFGIPLVAAVLCPLGAVGLESFKIMWLKNIHSGYVLGIAALLAPTLGVFGPLLIAPLAVATILGLLALRFRDRVAVQADWWLASVMGLVFAWMTLSLAWSIRFDEIIGKWAFLAAVISLVFVLVVFNSSMAENERRILRRFILAGIAIGYALTFFELATSNAISRHILGKDSAQAETVDLFNRSDSVLFVFVWPAVATLWRRWVPVALVLIGLGFVIGYILPSASALIGYTAGAAVFISALWAPRIVGAGVAAIVCLGILMAPALPGISPYLDSQYWRQKTGQINASLVHRLDIWEFTTKRIAEHPYAGWGFKAARSIPGGDEHYYLRDANQNIIGQGNRLPLHPHNGALQVWLELGVPGALGYSALFGLAALRAGRGANRTTSAMGLAVVATVIPIWMLSFGIWQSWWLGVIILATLLTMALSAETQNDL